MDMLLLPTEARMPPRAAPPTRKQELEAELQLAQERLHHHTSQAAIEENLIKDLERQLKRA